MNLNLLIGSKVALKKLLQDLAPAMQQTGLSLCVALIHVTFLMPISAYVPSPWTLELQFDMVLFPGIQFW